MILGKSRRFKGTGYVCFLDILGFSDDVCKHWNNPALNPLEKILSIKKDMPGFSEVEEDDGQATHRTYVCRVATISDSFTICFGYEDQPIVGDVVLGLEAVLANIAYIWSRCISNGYSVRGAIEFGDIYWDENELIGPAFINTYRLESNVAKNSRVIVASNLNGVLKNLVGRYKSNLTDHLFQSFRKDVDGYIIVNPQILYRSEAERIGLIDSLTKVRDAVSDAIVRAKYDPLIAMLTERVRVSLDDSDVGAY